MEEDDLGLPQRPNRRKRKRKRAVKKDAEEDNEKSSLGSITGLLDAIEADAFSEPQTQPKKEFSVIYDAETNEPKKSKALPFSDAPLKEEENEKPVGSGYQEPLWSTKPTKKYFVSIEYPGASPDDFEQFECRKERTFALIGTNFDADIYINHSSINRNHAVIQFGKGKAWVYDMDSRNGTYIRDRVFGKVYTERYKEIKVGDKLLFGSCPTEFVLRAHDPPKKRKKLTFEEKISNRQKRFNTEKPKQNTRRPQFERDEYDSRSNREYKSRRGALSGRGRGRDRRRSRDSDEPEKVRRKEIRTKKDMRRVDLPYVPRDANKPNVGSRCRVRRRQELEVAIITDEENGKFTVEFADGFVRTLNARDVYIPRWTEQSQTRAGIHGVVNMGDIEGVKMIVEERPLSVYAKDKAGNTPLLLALGAGMHRLNRNRNENLQQRLEIAKYLIENDSNLMARNRQGLFALMMCALDGFDEIAALLLQNGADYKQKLRNTTAFHVACENNQARMIETFLKYIPLDFLEEVDPKSGEDAWRMCTPTVRRTIEKCLQNIYREAILSCPHIKKMKVDHESRIINAIVDFVATDPLK